MKIREEGKGKLKKGKGKRVGTSHDQQSYPHTEIGFMGSGNREEKTREGREERKGRSQSQK